MSRKLACALLAFAALGAEADEELLTRAEEISSIVASRLPMGSEVADYLIMEPLRGLLEDNTFAKTTMRVADLDGDGQDEIVVLYVTGRGDDEALLTVGVLHRAEGTDQYAWRWKSEPFGYASTKVLPQDDPRREGYLAASFGVRDLNGDGQPDIYCTRSSYLAAGRRFEAWTWNGQTYEVITSVPSYVRFEEREKGVALITEFEPSSRVELAEPRTYEWDADKGMFELVGPPLETTPRKMRD